MTIETVKPVKLDKLCHFSCHFPAVAGAKLGTKLGANGAHCVLERFRVGRVGRVCTERRSLRFDAAPTSVWIRHLVDLAVASSHPSPVPALTC